MEQLVAVTRSNHIESIHYGYICVVDYTGKILFEIGDSNTKIYFRSSAKPIQTIPVIESGAAEYFRFTKQEISIMCSSHSGQKIHQDIVNDILEKIGEKANVLKCGIMNPYDEGEFKRLLEQKIEPSVLHCSCSGKHVGMVSLSKFLKFPTDNYESINHPIQKKILNTISHFSNYNEDKIIIGIDGCGVPVYLMPIYNIALSYARMMNFSKDNDKYYHKSSKLVVDSIVEYPEIIAGNKEFCTELIKNTNGKLIGKVGAEAIYCIGIKDREIGICIKIIDGNERALYPVVIKLLNDLGVLNKTELNNLSHWHKIELQNNLHEVTGEILPIFELEKNKAIKYDLGQKL